MVGRTHGIHAEPTTFGAKLALWALQVRRDRERLARARAGIAVGKLSGAVGTYSNVDPEVEAFVCERLGLTPVPATQVLARDRHAELLYACASLGATIESFALEIRHLQRTEVRRGRGAVPHRGPEGLERDAPQAQPGEERAALRPRTRPRGPTCRPGSRTSRSGTSATSRTRRSSASSSPTR